MPYPCGKMHDKSQLKSVAAVDGAFMRATEVVHAITHDSWLSDDNVIGRVPVSKLLFRSSWL